MTLQIIDLVDSHVVESLSIGGVHDDGYKNEKDGQNETNYSDRRWNL